MTIVKLRVSSSLRRRIKKKNKIRSLQNLFVLIFLLFSSYCVETELILISVSQAVIVALCVDWHVVCRTCGAIWCFYNNTHEFESCILLLREEETRNLTIVKLRVWIKVKQVKFRILNTWKNLKRLKLKGSLIIVCSWLAKTSWRLYCLSIVFCKELETIDRQTVLVTAGRWRHNRRIVQFPQNLFLAA